MNWNLTLKKYHNYSIAIYKLTHAGDWEGASYTTHIHQLNKIENYILKSASRIFMDQNVKLKYYGAW